MSRQPPPTLLGCGHFAQGVGPDGDPRCTICAEKTAIAESRAAADRVVAGPGPTRGQPAAVPDAGADAGWPTGERLLGEEPTQGVYDLPDSLYYADPLRAYGTESLSATSHRYLVAPSTPAHYRYRIDNPPKRTAAMIFGSAFHAETLGTADLAPFDGASWNSKAGEAFLALHPDHGDTVAVLARDVPAIKAMASAVRRHPIARRALHGGKPEQALFARRDDLGIRDDLGVWLRCKVDYLTEAAGNRLIVTDMKSTKSAHESEFATSAGKYAYDLQADATAYLARTLRLARNVTMVFVAVEVDPPYLANVHEIDTADLRTARAVNEAAERLFARCLETGEWPGYPARINRITLPSWTAQAREAAIDAAAEGDPE